MLGPHVVGQRIVVRRVVPGETGPSGGPALTDLLGVCVAWTEDACVVQPESGAPVSIPLSLIVSGKPVPPRPSVRHRVPPRDAELHSLAMWPDVPTRALGDWVLRSHVPPTQIARAGSALAMGDPGMSWEAAAREVVDHYAGIGRPAWAQVVVGSTEEGALTGLGWRAARPDEADSQFLVVPVSRLQRRLPDAGEVHFEESSPRATVTVGGIGGARGALDGDWLGLHDIWVADGSRRQGLAQRLMAELVDWGASLGATTAYLQVRSDNLPALGLYERLGFELHHTYRYLTSTQEIGSRGRLSPA